ncbi:MAG: hypothetical protein NTW55_03585 [Planctomycetota bacterium]|nr:hypothetical protein [Planctomycetota bacterium]
MNIHLSFHVFGSRKGYTTLAVSKDVTTQEQGELEQYSFGQTNNLQYLDSLESNPAYICRKLQSGRWAITRVKKGQPDEYNRYTLLFVTILLKDSDWLYNLKCNIRPLFVMSELWSWDGTDNLADKHITINNTDISNYTISEQTKNKALILLSILESNRNNTILVNETDYDCDSIILLNQLLPNSEKRKFSYAVRALSNRIKLSLISLSSEAQISHIRDCLILTNHSIRPDSVYAEMISKSWSSNNQPPWSFIEKCDGLFQTEYVPVINQALTGTSKVYKKNIQISRSRLKIHKVLLFILLAILISGATLFIYKKASEKKVRNDLVSQTNAFLEKNNLADADKINKDSFDQYEQLIMDIDSNLIHDNNNVLLLRCKTELQKWFNDASDINSKYKNVERAHSRYLSLQIIKDDPDAYPDPNKYQKILDIEDDLNGNKNNARQDKIFEIKIALQEINGYKEKCLNLLNRVNDQYQKLLGKIREPNTYDPNYCEKLNNIQVELNSLKSSISNANESPVKKDQRYAKDLTNKINHFSNQCTDDKNKMEDWKSQSDESCKSARQCLKDPNTQDPNTQDPNKLCDVAKNLAKAKRCYHENPNIKNIIDEIKKISKEKRNEILNCLPKDEIGDNIRADIKEDKPER